MTGVFGGTLLYVIGGSLNIFIYTYLIFYTLLYTKFFRFWRKRLLCYMLQLLHF